MANANGTPWFRILAIAVPMLGLAAAWGSLSARVASLEDMVAKGILPDAESRINSLEFKIDGVINGTLGDRYTRTEALRDKAEIMRRLEAGGL